MNRTLIYDLPTRIFHLLFACLFTGAFLVAKTIDDENPLFSYHMLSGLLLAFLVILRLIWGIFGAKYARFSSFAIHPVELFNYLKGILGGSKRTWPGHNPASSWAALFMFTFALGLAVTGFLMTTGQKERFEDAHEFLANGFLVTTLMHVSGVVLHMICHKDGLAMSMVHGKKKTLPLTEPGNTHYVVSIIFILLISIFSAGMIRNYNENEGSLTFLGNRMKLDQQGLSK